ncbi:hypothetical protein J2R99_002201 [Rhodopseudomonas julia]|uniref:Lipoprotein n=1 Tax=Rhodopseudomonas julia TaxID=200617 RepID=A0ABU0CB72_9BRAD|nr:hypothetical protein [Rhodopseudomonas julia]MDQ0326332.1 hypothetical protein [Rhodopseudomonas julia]
MTRFPSLPVLPLALPLALIFALSACSPDADQQEANGTASKTFESAAASGPQETSGSRSSPETGPAKVIGLDGLGDLRIGNPVPEGGSFAERGAQTSDACRTVSSPDYPGVYAIVADGKVQRITVGQRSDVKLAEGVGVGSTETEVRSWFGGFREEPHKYEEAPAKYLTAPNAESGTSALRFEIGREGKVKLFHIGVMPYLAYVEACA